ncbi:MAG TPA: hypothetical protein VGC70_02655, partial [Burkholderiales bacterium]
MSLRRGAWLFITTLLVALTAVGAGATWLVYTESGLAWLSTRIAGYAGKGLTLDGVAGTLAHGASVAHIRYAGEDIELHITSAALRVSPLSLLQLKPRIIGLSADEIAIVTKPGEPRGRPPDSLRLPLDFELTDARVTRLVIDLGKGPHELTNIRLDYEGGRAHHTVRDLTLNALDHAATARLVISTVPPFALDAALEAVPTQRKETRVYAAVKGNLTEVAIEGGATSGSARVHVTANVRPYDEYPLTTLVAHTARLDLKTLWPQLPRTVLDGDLALKRSGALYAGSLRISNAASGPYDQALLPLAALRASIRTDGTTARITNGVADLGAAGAVTVSGTLERASAKLALTTSRLDVRGLHGKLRKTALAGRADVVIAPERQSLTAELTQSDVDLRLTANRTGDTIEVPQF